MYGLTIRSALSGFCGVWSSHTVCTLCGLSAVDGLTIRSALSLVCGVWSNHTVCNLWGLSALDGLTVRSALSGICLFQPSSFTRTAGGKDSAILFIYLCSEENYTWAAAGEGAGGSVGEGGRGGGEVLGGGGDVVYL